MGMVLCIPVLIVGLVLIVVALRRGDDAQSVAAQSP